MPSTKHRITKEHRTQFPLDEHEETHYKSKLKTNDSITFPRVYYRKGSFSGEIRLHQFERHSLSQGLDCLLGNFFLIGDYTVSLFYYLKQVTPTLYISENEQNHHINKELEEVVITS